jgi:hypothetical protein
LCFDFLPINARSTSLLGPDGQERSRDAHGLEPGIGDLTFRKMPASAIHPSFERVLAAVGECLDRPSAEALLRLQAHPELQARTEALTEKALKASSRRRNARSTKPLSAPASSLPCCKQTLTGFWRKVILPDGPKVRNSGTESQLQWPENIKSPTHIRWEWRGVREIACITSASSNAGQPLSRIRKPPCSKW